MDTPHFLLNGTVAIALGLLIGFVYAKRYGGFVLSRSFVHTCVVTVPLVALTIEAVLVVPQTANSDFQASAIAFALVGLLGLIRFRTVVRDTREFTFIFLSLVCGVGIGASLYLQTTLTCLCVLALLVGLERCKFGEPVAPSIRARVLGDASALIHYANALQRISTRFEFVSLNSVRDEATTYTFDIIAKREQTMESIAASLHSITGTREIKIQRLQRSKGADSDGE